MFRLNLYIPLITVLLLISLFTIISVIYIQENTIHKSKDKVSDQYMNFLNEKVHHDAFIISEYINFIQSNKNITAEFQRGNKKQLYASMEKIYERLNRNIDLTHMYFIKTDGTVLLRVHDYNKDHDTIDRATFIKAKEKQELVYGLEFGIKKNYTLRVVKPWYADGKLIGYIELGKEIDKIMDEYTALMGTNIYLAVKKDIYRNAPEYIQTRLRQKTSTKDYYLVYNTFAVPKEIESILNGSITECDVRFNDRDYYVSKTILSDFSQKDLGYFVFLQDVTMEHNVMYTALKALIVMLIVLATVFFILASILIRKKEKSINQLTSKLEEKREELFLLNSKLQKLFDLQKNIVILTDGKTLNMANKTMLDFFGYVDLDHFLQYYNCICDRFIEDDQFFHLGKVAESRNWVEALKKLPQENRIVAFLDQDQETRVYSVAINEFEADNYVIAFTDISNTVREQFKLLQKVTHDPLTGAFNREFLDNHIDQIIQEAEPKKLAIIMCDIDDFKRVNDIFGHNRGDEVLKQFVTIIEKSIRDEDYLIRWGGEEFIVLMKADTIDTLQKIAENIRAAIEKSFFEEVGTITSSFGATLYKKEETISESISRVDKALYKAKANGKNQVQII